MLVRVRRAFVVGSRRHISFVIRLWWLLLMFLLLWLRLPRIPLSSGLQRAL
jgi:hypothetical protein